MARYRLDSASGARGTLDEASLRGLGSPLNRPYPVEVFSNHVVSSINVL